jgi:eukaryotic-like serine/threonine-protein kinase
MQLPVWQAEIMLKWHGRVQAAAAGASGIGTTVVGTYGYMAPEQFRGAASPASDLYGLGGTLLFLLSGAAAVLGSGHASA